MKVITLLACVVVVLAEPPVRNTYYFAKQQETPYPASGWKPDGPAFDLPQKQAPAKQYGAPVAPERQYGAPAVPENQYGAPAAPEHQYGAPAAPERQNDKITAPARQYGAPGSARFSGSFKSASSQTNQQAPQQQYGAPVAPERHYGAPTPQNHYGTPEYATPSYSQAQYPSDSSTTADYDETTFPTTESQAEPVDKVNELDEVGNVDEQKQGEYFIALPDGRLQRVQYVSRQDIEAMKYFAKIQAENVEPLRGPIYAYQPLQKLQFAPANLEVEGVAAKLQVPVAAKVQEVAVPVASFSSLNYQPEQRFLINF